MKPTVHQRTQLGELVVAVFDEASQYSDDPREVSRLAVEALSHILKRARGSSRYRGDCHYLMEFKLFDLLVH